MAAEVILALDQGTTNTKALLVDRTGTPVFRTAVPVSVLSLQAGFVEQDPMLLWSSVVEASERCAAWAGKEGLRVAGIALSNQRETALAWRAGAEPRPVGNAISWQCRRSQAICERMSSHHAEMRSITGLPVDPLNSAGKWMWLLEHDPAVRDEIERGEVLLGNVDAWLLNNLSRGGVHATDHTNASRTGLYSLRDLAWSDSLLALFDIPRKALPAVQPSASHFATCSAIAALEGVPVVAMIGDSHAALVGHGGLTPGSVKATYGTGSSLMMLTERLPEDSASLARTIAWSDADGPRFALEGNIAMTGSAVQWVGEFFGFRRPVEDTVALANTVADAAGLRFVPAMVGLGAPYWDTHARGLIANLGTTHRAAHLARAALDAIAFQVADVLFAMERESGVRVLELHVDGGATRNDTLMQLQTDLIRRPLVRAEHEELSALGAARLGGVTLGWWPLTDAP